MKRALAVIAIALVAGCAARRPAPVMERGPQPMPPPVRAEPQMPAEAPVEKPLATHTVKKGETLAAIALQYGLDYRELAAWNNIVNPNRIEIGQVLIVSRPPEAQPLAAPVITPLATAGPPIESRPLGNSPNAKVEPRASKVPYSERALAQMAADTSPAPVAAEPPPPSPVASAPTPAPPPVAAPEPEKPAAVDNEDVEWIWPVKGKVIAPFSESAKGMDIGGRKGAPVLAAAAGRIVYAGTGLRGYGKLVIIKHNDTWLSAYAHNDNIVVKEQQDVRKGQKIAEMGSTDADQVKLHFEVRRQGKPVDPARILPAM